MSVGILPQFALIEQPIIYSDALERTEIIEKPCSQTTQASLNRQAAQLKFSFSGEVLYRISSPKTGIRIKCEFRTRTGANTNRNALTTLASNFFGHCFGRATLRIGGYEIESISNPGVVMDCLYHCEESDFRNKSGSRFGFMPDTSGEVSTRIGRRQGDVAPGVDGQAVPGLVTSVNAVANRVVSYNPEFNEGFNRRYRAYNYTVAGDDDYRRLDIFIPLNKLFGFCEEFDRVLEYVNFDVTLDRTNYPTNCMYGENNTSIDFGQANDGGNGGITEMMLEVETVLFKPKIMEEIEEKLSKPFETTYLRRICSENQEIGENRTGIFPHVVSNDLEGLPRYVFCVFKDRADDTATNNFQRCSHANIHNISVRYGAQIYPNRLQNADFFNNEFSRFYDDFCDVCRSLGYNNPGLSWEEFRDMYTIFALDLSAQKNLSKDELIISFQRRDVPAAGDATAQNPRAIRGFCVILAESKIEIDCANKVVRKK